MRRRLISAPRGLTLLELVIAIGILSLGTLAALNATNAARETIGGAAPRLLAQLAAMNHAEALRLSDLEAPTDVELGPYRFRIETEQRSTAAGLLRVDIRAISSEGPGARFVTVLPEPGGAVR